LIERRRYGVSNEGFCIARGYNHGYLWPVHLAL
jgi:hypothetical protein